MLAGKPVSKRDVVVVGTSAGGLAALSELCQGLPADFPASVLVVQHIGAHPSSLHEILSARGRLDAVQARQGQGLEHGKIYVAPPDRHMLVEGYNIVLTHGPKENYARPAVDPLFRSAALSLGSSVIGVVLTGHLDDGTAGMQAVKQCGGLALVQNPAEAHAKGMPASVASNVDVDYCLALADIAPTLVKLTSQLAPARPVAPDHVWREHEASLGKGDVMEQLEAIAKPSSLVCPECTGTLWELASSTPPRYRCHTGHAYTLRSLAHSQVQGAEAALWSALRALQDQEAIMRKLGADCRAKGDAGGAADADAQAGEVAARAAVVEGLVRS